MILINKLLNLCIKFAQNVENSIDEKFIERIFIFGDDGKKMVYTPSIHRYLNDLISSIKNFNLAKENKNSLEDEFNDFEYMNNGQQESFERDLEENKEFLYNSFEMFINSLSFLICGPIFFASDLLAEMEQVRKPQIENALSKAFDLRIFNANNFPIEEIENKFIPKYQEIISKIDPLQDQFIPINLNNLSAIIENYHCASELLSLTLELLKLLKIKEFNSYFNQLRQAINHDILYMEEEIYPIFQKNEEEKYLKEIDEDLRERLDKPNTHIDEVDPDHDPTLTEEDYQDYFAHPTEYIGPGEYRKKLKEVKRK